jgi:hypothetical protein
MNGIRIGCRLTSVAVRYASGAVISSHPTILIAPAAGSPSEDGNGRSARLKPPSVRSPSQNDTQREPTRRRADDVACQLGPVDGAQLDAQHHQRGHEQGQPDGGGEHAAQTVTHGIIQQSNPVAID